MVHGCGEDQAYQLLVLPNTYTAVGFLLLAATRLGLATLPDHRLRRREGQGGRRAPAGAGLPLRRRRGRGLPGGGMATARPHPQAPGGDLLVRAVRGEVGQRELRVAVRTRGLPVAVCLSASSRGPARRCARPAGSVSGAPWGGTPASAGWRGSPKICSGGPCSTITPPSMKTTRSATSRAKPISWVTTIMVMPSRARSCITSSTSPTSSGSSAEVGSSKSITSGSMASARAMATRCCWPPESRAGTRRPCRPGPTRSSRRRPARLGLGARAAPAPASAPR